MERTLIYARVSTEDQVEKYGLPVQLRACREFAAHRGFSVTEEICDEGISGATLDRPGLERLRKLVRDGAADVVLTYDVDRLSRELAQLLILKPEIEKGARLEFVNANFENSPSGRMFFGIRGVIAQYERELTRERTMRGRRERARAGLIVGGRVPYGYRYDAGRLVPDPERAEIAREIFRLYNAGQSMREIALYLRASRAPTWSGRQWGHSSVRRILVNETYAGTAYFGTHRREGKLLRLRQASERISLRVTPLIDRATWELAQARIAENPKVGRPSNAYLLRGSLYCSCGRRMSGERSRKNYAYRCSGRDTLRFPGGPCRCSVSVPKLDAAVWAAITGELMDTAFARRLIAKYGQPENDAGKLSMLRSSLCRLKAREDAALASMLDPDLQDVRSTFKSAYQKARAERQRIEAQITQTEEAGRWAKSTGEWIEESVSLLREYIQTRVTTEQRREFLAGLVSRAEWDGTELSLSCFLPIPQQAVPGAPVPSQGGVRELVTTC
jgi:site-specific DNA recombinase